MIAFACVLQNAPKCPYTVEYITRMQATIFQAYRYVHAFFVLTDLPRPSWFVDTATQMCHWEEINGWPGWWSKIELFRPGRFHGFDRVVYFDLDTVIYNLDWVHGLPSDRFAALTDWLEPPWMNSSVMSWEPGNDTDEIYRRFASNPIEYQRIYRRYPDMWGDQGFIQGMLQHVGKPIAYLQDLFPGEFTSFKVHSVPEKQRSSVVCFHGRPRPHEVNFDGTAHFSRRR